MKKYTYGFTVVELAVVISVIAILASISVVAYNGVQKEAAKSATLSDTSASFKKIELAKGNNDGAFPASVTDCPTPASGNICLPTDASNQIIYNTIPKNTYSPSAPIKPGYEIASLNSRQFSYVAQVEQTGSNEFLRFADFAPYVDKYGLVEYKLSFDIKSANIANRSTVSVYFQNGGGARYSFGTSVPVTTSFVRQTVLFTPTVSNLSVATSHLAFYGTYGTGNISTVKNVTLELAN